MRKEQSHIWVSRIRREQDPPPLSPDSMYMQVLERSYFSRRKRKTYLDSVLLPSSDDCMIEYFDWYDECLLNILHIGVWNAH